MNMKATNSIPQPNNSAEAFAALKVVRDDLRELILQAPISLEERKSLALMTTAQLMGITGYLFVACQPSLKGQPMSVILEKISEVLIAQMQSLEAAGEGKIA